MDHQCFPGTESARMAAVPHGWPGEILARREPADPGLLSVCGAVRTSHSGNRT